MGVKLIFGVRFRFRALESLFFGPLILNLSPRFREQWERIKRTRLCRDLGVGSTSAQPDEVEDGMVDGSFHTPEWHAARLASLKTTRKSIRTSKREGTILVITPGKIRKTEIQRRQEAKRESIVHPQSL
ncbi:Uncharacterized protein Rs2_18925 [Raphanus sativus]|nr:Uncharacterized protein Rs2_18925 [Raphanus sativus]